MSDILKYGNISSKKAMELEEKYGAQDYQPLPVVLAKGEGVFVWDPEGNRYYDCLSAHSSVNQGHCHPRIIDALTTQARTFNLGSRAFYNNQLGDYEEYITQYFGYDMVLPMNTGVEGVETALKLARKWAYTVKGVAKDSAILLFASDNFHGRTLALVSASTTPSHYCGFGPFLPGIATIPFNDAKALQCYLEKHGKNVAAFVIEPTQGQAGVLVPDDGYLKQCFDLCRQHQVLFVADEIQSGLARTGKLLDCDYDGVRPDILVLGKALSGGVLPVSAVLADREVMLCIKPGEHGSTFGGNPMACVVAKAALEVIKDENLAENAFEQGAYFRKQLSSISHPMLQEVRGRGLLNAIVVQPQNGVEAWDLCLMLKDRGVLCYPTRRHAIRITPPLVITRQQVKEVTDIIADTIESI